jgi:hypothetical protein
MRGFAAREPLLELEEEELAEDFPLLVELEEDELEEVFPLLELDEDELDDELPLLELEEDELDDELPLLEPEEDELLPPPVTVSAVTVGRPLPLPQKPKEAEPLAEMLLS